MLQDQSRNRTPMPDAQQATDVAQLDLGPARAEAGIAEMLAQSPKAVPIEIDLASACISQVKRLKWWDENPDSFTDEEGDAEMERWGAVFRRAINEPSSGPADLAAKAQLMLSDLDRFYPVERYRTDNFRLMRVIMHDAINLALPESNRQSCESVVPGSSEAMAAWRAACTEFDRRTRLGDDEARRLRIGETMTLWTPDKVRSAINRDFSSATSGNEAVAMAAMSRAELQELLVLTLQRDIRFEEAARDTRIHECFARAYPDEADPVSDTDGVADPTLAAITAHKAVYAAWLPHLKATSEAISGTEHDRECEAAAEAPRSHEDAAYEALIGTPPTTFVGLVALADYLPGAVLRNAVTDEDDDGLRALSTMCSAIKDLAGRDAELIALGRQYDRLHAEWLVAEEANREPARRCAAAVKRAEHLQGDDYTAAMRLAWHLPGVDEAHQAKEAAFEAIEAVAEAILAFPASTPAGFAVKARVLIWGQWPGGQFGETAEEDLHNDYGRRCARLLIESACAAAGVNWRGQPVSEQEYPPATPSLADQMLVCWREWSEDPNHQTEEESEATKALNDRRDALTDAAEALPATRENLPAKALALAWSGYIDLWRNGQSRDAYGSDGRLALDIDTAICGRLKTGY